MSEHGEVWWTELNTHHPDSSRKFYTDVLGLKANIMAMGDMSRGPKPGEPSYTVFMLGEKPACGMMTLEGEHFKHVPSHWLTYFAVKNVDQSAKAVAAAGGKVCMPPFDIPGVGRIAVVEDANHVRFGLGTPAPMGGAAATASAETTKAAGGSKAKSGAKKKG
jgi:uncharacterized protein